MEVLGFPTDLMDQLYKLFSTRLCANTIGQIVVDVMVKPPLPGEPSFPLYYEVSYYNSTCERWVH